MSLEGNDVASNLKWIMSSNSIAVTPRLTQETWFMEGTLIPNYHYVEVKEDFSDLEERLTYYIDHPDEAEAIICHAHEYVKQFFDTKREKLISLLVLKKYFEITNGSIII
jgi:spore maturation protein CgeB